VEELDVGLLDASAAHSLTAYVDARLIQEALLTDHVGRAASPATGRRQWCRSGRSAMPATSPIPRPGILGCFDPFAPYRGRGRGAGPVRTGPEGCQRHPDLGALHGAGPRAPAGLFPRTACCSPSSWRRS
jgi:hypothetical protein